MGARSSITAALTVAFLIAFLAEDWLTDVRGWVVKVTTAASSGDPLGTGDTQNPPPGGPGSNGPQNGQGGIPGVAPPGTFILPPGAGSIVS